MANEPLKTAVVTNVGIVKLEAAYQAGEKVIISQMALGNSNLAYVVPDPAFTELVNEFGRQDINEGNTTDSWINALVYVDSQQFAGESILEFGLYDTDGDLIVYSSYTPSVVPAVGQDYIQLEIECSVDLYNASAVTIEVTPIYPQATELERGIAKVATEADVAAGIDDEKIVTPKKIAKHYATSDKVNQIINSYGIGAGAPNITDANSQQTGRINTLVTPWTNGPISANGALLCFGESNAVNLQIFSVHGPGQVYWRFRTGSAGTTAWRKVWDDRNNGSISDALAGTSGVYADCSVLKNLLAQTTVGGSNQTWANYTASRVSNVNYTNNTYAPIVVSITASEDGATGVIYVGGVKIANFSDSGGDLATTSFIVPVGSTYKIIFTMNSQVIWSELR